MKTQSFCNVMQYILELKPFTDPFTLKIVTNYSRHNGVLHYIPTPSPPNR